MRRRNIQKGTNQLAAEYWSALRKHARCARIFASEEHLRGLIKAEDPQRVLRALEEARVEAHDMINAFGAMERLVRASMHQGDVTDKGLTTA
jgi:hypothetical protein